jgi:PKHD-type hydroxylase
VAHNKTLLLCSGSFAAHCGEKPVRTVATEPTLSHCERSVDPRSCITIQTMIIHHLKQVLAADELTKLRQIASRTRWDDGAKTAGIVAAPHKRNTEISVDSADGKAAAEIAVSALRRHPLFFSATLPASMSPPMMNRYVAGMEYGDHCDAAILGRGNPIRADISATLFISNPEDYEGGELVIDVAPGGHATKLAAGDLMVYPANTIHHVAKVTRGERVAMVFWIQSMVRDTERRAMLYDMGQTLDRLDARLAATPELTQLYTYYYNLIRMWAVP